MKKTILTLLLVLILATAIFAETGTVVLYYNNGTVSYSDTQTFYEFDVQAYVSSGDGSNVFSEGQIYVEYDTTVFGSNVVDNSKITSITKMGPLAESSGLLYNIIPSGGNDTYADAFSVAFEATQAYDSGWYGSSTYISTSSSSLTTIMRIKLEASVSGSSNLDWPSSVTGINNLFREHDGTNSGAGSTYDALSITNANETTTITYSDTGDPALAISLKNFAAQYEASQVVLNWTTESETQNLGYIIKRAIKYSDNDISEYEVISTYLENDDLIGAGTTTQQNEYTFYDTKVKPGVTYLYMLEDVDFNGMLTSHGPISIIIPESMLVENEDFRLGSNYPNPFNPSFTIPFELMKAMDVNIAMYDIRGNKVMLIADGYYEARQYQLRVNASNLNSGIYFVRTIIGNEVNTQKMTLLK